MHRLKQLLVSLTAAVALLAIMVGIPIGLVIGVGWPLPSALPNALTGTETLTTAIEQRNIATEVVVNTLAVVVWVLWAQLLWALIWELVVNGRRLANGLLSKPAPLVAAPLNALAVRLVSGLLAASVVATSAATSLSLPATPSFAGTSGLESGSHGAHGVHEVLVAAPELERTPTERPGPGGRSMPERPRPDGGPSWLVKEGDSLWSIAETTFGDGERSAEVLGLNPDLASARSVRPGLVLRMPLGSAVPQDRIPPAAAHVPAAAIRVEPGDNLWDLSEHRLERVTAEPGPAMVADHVAEVVRVNSDQIDDPDLIHPGQVFTFPSIGEDPYIPGSPEPRPAEPEPSGEMDHNARSRPPENETANDGADEVAETRNPETRNPETRDAETGNTDAGDVETDEAGTGDADGEAASSVGAPLVLGVAGAFLAAGVLDLARRRWRYRMSHRSPGTVPRVPDESLGSAHRALHREADEPTRRWVHAAIGSLSLRPLWKGEQLAQPLVVRLKTESLEAEFDGADPMAAPVPWTTADDGRHWRLDRATTLDELGPQPTGSPLPTLVTVGAETLVNLEAMGVLGIEGPGTDPMALVRSIVHELATSPAAGAIDIRSTVPILGVGSYDLVQVQSPTELAVELPSWLADVETELARTSSANAYGHRLATDFDPIGPVVVVTDEAGCRSMPLVLDYARRCSLPLAVVVVGPLDSTGADNLIRLGPTTARLEPAGFEFEPQLLSAEMARELGRLLEEVATDGEEPLVTPLELSASVTDIRRGNAEPVVIQPPVRPTLRAVDATAEHDADVSAVGEPPIEQTASAVETPDLRADDETTETSETTETIPSGETPDTADTAEGDVVDTAADGQPAEIDEPSAEVEVAGITIKVLGDVTADGVLETMTSQQLSLVCYLACHGSSSRDSIIEALWDGQVISKSRFPNLLAETRARIGRHHFPEARDGRYELKSVDTDLARFEQQVAAAHRHDAGEVVPTLREALELVRGVPFTPPGRRFWSWVGEHSHVAARVESMVADTAARLARIEQERGNLEGARWACEKGLLASPTDETLVVVLTELYVELGRPGLARRLVDSWENRVSQMDCGEPSDEPRKRLAG